MSRYARSNFLEALAAQFPPNEWALLPEVRNRSGFRATRSADAVAMNFWPSRGLAVWGFEFKEHRSDWLRELKKPEKADAMAAFCNCWSLVAAPDVCKDEELPKGWGLYIVEGNKCRTVRRPIDTGDKELGREFVANMLRRAREYVVPEAVTAKALQEALEQGRGESRYAREQAERELATLRERLNQFEKASGIRIDAWTFNLPHLGRAAKMLAEGLPTRQMDDLCRRLDAAAAAAREARDAAALFKPLDAGQEETAA